VAGWRAPGGSEGLTAGLEGLEPSIKMNEWDFTLMKRSEVGLRERFLID